MAVPATHCAPIDKDVTRQLRTEGAPTLALDTPRLGQNERAQAGVVVYRNRYHSACQPVFDEPREQASRCSTRPRGDDVVLEPAVGVLLGTLVDPLVESRFVTTGSGWAQRSRARPGHPSTSLLAQRRRDVEGRRAWVEIDVQAAHYSQHVGGMWGVDLGKEQCCGAEPGHFGEQRSGQDVMAAGRSHRQDAFIALTSQALEQRGKLAGLVSAIGEGRLAVVFDDQARMAKYRRWAACL